MAPPLCGLRAVSTNMLIRLQILPKTLILHSSFTPKIPSKPFITFTTAATATATAAPRIDTGLNFRQKILYLEALRVNPKKVLEQNPNIRSASLASLESVENCLRSMGIERSALGRILDMYPQLLTSDPYSDLYPIFDFLLNDVDIPFHEIRVAIIRCPRLLACNVEAQLRPTLQFLEHFGFVGQNKINSQTTMLLVSNVEFTLIPKIEFLRGIGFSYDEVVTMVLRSPGLLTLSIEKNYRPKVDYFLNEMKGNLEDLKRFPQFFSFSLEGRIKPRHKLLVNHGFSLTLPEMLRVSDGEFSSMLIEMRLQILENTDIHL